MLRLNSTAFEREGELPASCTCDGAELSPPLHWESVPDGTKSLALLVDDPDAPDPAAPKRVWVHWILYNLPPTLTALTEGAGNRPPAGGAREGLNDSNTQGYEGPCPPKGRHRYFFHLFALDTLLPDLGAKARRRDLENAMQGHVLEEAVLMGAYARRQ